LHWLSDQHQTITELQPKATVMHGSQLILAFVDCLKLPGPNGVQGTRRAQ
jgi:hypothetical protein